MNEMFFLLTFKILTVYSQHLIIPEYLQQSDITSLKMDS